LAFAALHRALDRGHGDACSAIGVAYADAIGVERDLAMALHWFRRGAEQDSVRSTMALADSFRLGKGVEISHVEAHKWYLRAAELGSAEGMACVGLCFRKGHGVEQNHATSIEWFHRAADAGNASMAYFLATVYERGENVAVDVDKGNQMMTLAAKLGDPRAIEIMSKRGKDVKQDVTIQSSLSIDFIKALPSSAEKVVSEQPAN
jgi:TPR repeat protein